MIYLKKISIWKNAFVTQGLKDQNVITYRKGIDLVNDHPENSLMREVDTIKSSQDKMRRTLEQVWLMILAILDINDFILYKIQSHLVR